MSRRDMDQLIERARRAGGEVTRCGSGHWKVVGPRGVAILPATPRSPRAVANGRGHLRRAGLEIAS
jgi:hypothetical protein